MTVEMPGAAELGLGMAATLARESRVTRANWTLPPYNRWAFQNVQMVT